MAIQFGPILWAIGGMIVRSVSKKSAERLATEGARRLSAEAAKKLIAEGAKVIRATNKNVDKIISEAKAMEKGVEGIRSSGSIRGSSSGIAKPSGLGSRPKPPTVQLRSSNMTSKPSLGRGIKSGADDFKFAEVISPKTSKTPRLEGPKIRKDADDAILGELGSVKGIAPYPLVNRIVSSLRQALEDGERRVEIEPILNEMEKVLEVPNVELGSSAGADEMPPDLDTTVDDTTSTETIVEEEDDTTTDSVDEPTFKSFGEAFSYHRREKQVPSFMYKGNLYTTRFKEESIPQHKDMFNVTGTYAEDYASRQGE